MFKKKMSPLFSAGILIIFVLSSFFTTPALAASNAVTYPITHNPIWCPLGIKPIPNTLGCSGTFTNLESLIASITAPSVNGVIWIPTGTDTSSSSIIIDGGTFPTWANYSLKIQGGWSGSYTGSITPTATLFSQSIAIINWNNDVAVNDVSITGASGDGLTVTTTGTKTTILTKTIITGNIYVHHVNPSGSGSGAVLNNSSGAGIIKVDNSTFSNNTGGRGLNLTSNGAITLLNITANSNATDGLNAITLGNISLTKVTASSNLGNGAVINNNTGTLATILVRTSVFNSNTGGKGLDVYSNGTVTINTVTANSNGTDGLDVTSAGIVSITKETANLNSGNGAFVDNSSSTGNLAVNITSSTFAQNSNTGYGLKVFSKGPIKLTSVLANSNSNGDGAYVDNCSSNGTNCTVTYPITISSSTFKNNTNGSGLSVYSGGAISLSRANASGNSGYGAHIVNNVATTNSIVSIASSTFNSNTAGTQPHPAGLTVASKGNITINTSQATGNAGFGAYLRNSFSGVTSSTINVIASTFKTNLAGGLDSGSGIGAFSNSDITFNKAAASGNAYDGVYVANAANIYVKCGSNFSSNTGYGIEAVLSGTVTISKLVTLLLNIAGPTYINSGSGTPVTLLTCP